MCASPVKISKSLFYISNSMQYTKLFSFFCYCEIFFGGSKFLFSLSYRTCCGTADWLFITCHCEPQVAISCFFSTLSCRTCFGTATGCLLPVIASRRRGNLFWIKEILKQVQYDPKNKIIPIIKISVISGSDSTVTTPKQLRKESGNSKPHQPQKYLCLT